MGQVAGVHQNRALMSFQVGRWLGYSLMGGLAALSVQALGWLTVESAALRPVWSMLHVGAVVLGLLLIWQAKQPVWLDQSAQQLWGKIRRFNSYRDNSGNTSNAGKFAPLIVGVLWAFMPCGLLYSALMVAALTGNALEGAVTMACFALGSGVSLGFAPWLLLKLKTIGDGAWGIRLAGLALASTSAWALWMGLAHNQAPWCVT
jgi:sulfite exporter TauE/SafE